MVTGSIWWADKPFEGVQVDVGTSWLYTCNGVKFSDTTKADGSFSIVGVAPGEYQLITKYLGQRGETEYFTGANLFPLSITVAGGDQIDVERISICKMDLYLYAPILNGKSVTFSWKPYPGATDYDVNIWYNNAWLKSWGTKGLNTGTTLDSGSYQVTVFVYGPACSQGTVNFTVP